MHRRQVALAAAAVVLVIAARAAAAQNGVLVCPYQSRLVLVRGDGQLVTVQGRGDVPVAAGTYRIRSGELSAVKDGKTWKYTFRGQGQVTVGAGQRVNCPVGPPLTLKVKVQKAGNVLQIRVVILGGGGEQYTDVTVDGKHPAEATWKLVTGAGDVQARGTFHYG